jgi:hypothetical protein
MKNSGLLHNKPKTEVHPGHKLTGTKDKKKKNSSLLHNKPKDVVQHWHKLTGPKKKKRLSLAYCTISLRLRYIRGES